MEPMILEIWDHAFVKEVAGWLYYLAPGYRPRNADTVIQKAMTTFRSKAKKNVFGAFVWSIPNDRLYDELNELFMAIPEFVELNLSEDELERGVKVDDEDRPKFIFTTSRDVQTEESRRYDFIDLTAFIQDLTSTLSAERV